MRRAVVGLVSCIAAGIASYQLLGREIAGSEPPAKSGDPSASSASSQNGSRSQNPPFGSAKEIERHFDRLKIQALADYVGSGKRSDVETAYMLLFNAVIEHDLFADYEDIAERYLKDRPFGAVTPLAGAIKAMALAGRAEFGQAAKTYSEMVTEISPQNARFAWTFAEALARQALAAGEYPPAREIFSAVTKQFPDDSELQQEVTSHLKKIERVGQPAPHFAVTDLDDKKISLDDYRGKIVLLDFWATWCAPCIAELPGVSAVYDKYRRRGFEVVAISLDEDVEAVRQFVKERKLPWRQIVNRGDKERDIVSRYGVDKLPATFLVDGDGTIQRVDLRGDDLEKAVTELLGRKSSARKGANLR